MRVAHKFLWMMMNFCDHFNGSMILAEFMCRGYLFVCQISSWKICMRQILAFFFGVRRVSVSRICEERATNRPTNRPNETQFRFEWWIFTNPSPLWDWIADSICWYNTWGIVIRSSQSYHNAHISYNLSCDGFNNVLFVRSTRSFASRFQRDDLNMTFVRFDFRLHEHFTQQPNCFRC